MSTLRSFIALPTSSEVQSRILRVLEKLESIPSDVRWDTPDKFHITLKFLGNTEALPLEPLSQHLESQIATIKAFDVTYSEIGGFPDLSQPRVLWIGARRDPDLMSLQTLIEETCAMFGFKKDDRAFHPHVTLGRVKGPRGLDRLTAMLKSLTFEPVIAHCTKLHLVRSELHPAGSRYTVLKSIPLKS